MGLQIFCKPIFAGCDMKGKQATYLEIASLCRELALLLHAGVRAGDGLALLAEEEPETQRRKQLEEMARQVDDGASLGEALAGQGLFPAYVTGLVTVGERSGRTEEALNALSVYYEQRDQLDRQVRSALLYPSVLLALMLVVIVVLLAKVLPVFDQVYASLGGELTGVAGGLLTLGRALDAAMPVLCAVLGVVVIFLAVFSLSGGFRERLLAFCNNLGPVYFLGFVLPLLHRKLVLPYVFGMYGIPLLYGISLRYSVYRNRIPEKTDQAFGRDNAAKLLEPTGPAPLPAMSLTDALDDAITAAGRSILQLGGYMIFFNLLNLLPRLLLPDSFRYAPLLEISGGLKLLGDRFPLYTLLLLPFGGLSCIAQTGSCIRNTGLSLKSYILHKMVLTVLTAAYYLGWFLLSPDTFLL